LIYSTRFNPTMNGYLHIGHLYNVLVNYHEAKRSGGRFGVRLDDNQRYWYWRNTYSEEDSFEDAIMDDFEWMGIEPDYWSSQENLSPVTVQLIREEFEYDLPREAFTAAFGAEVVGMPFEFYPMVPSLTAEKVAYDFMEHINLVVRGIDLLSEDCLYRYFVNLFMIPQPRMIYIPRLTFEGSGIVSKTEGNFKLKTYREKGIPAHDIIEHLAQDCQKIPGLGWYLENIKPNPVLGAWANELHPG